MSHNSITFKKNPKDKIPEDRYRDRVCEEGLGGQQRENRLLCIVVSVLALGLLSGFLCFIATQSMVFYCDRLNKLMEGIGLR